jgi:hypothetical protein
LFEDGDAEDDDEYFAVWPENWKTVRIFLALSHCWRRNEFTGQFLGIPRSDIESTLIMFNVRPIKRCAMLESLAEMESAALEVLNRK